MNSLHVAIAFLDIVAVQVEQQSVKLNWHGESCNILHYIAMHEPVKLFKCGTNASTSKPIFIFADSGTFTHPHSAHQQAVHFNECSKLLCNFCKNLLYTQNKQHFNGVIAIVARIIFASHVCVPVCV